MSFFLERGTRQRLSLSWLQCNTSRLLLVCLDVQVTRVVVVGVVLCVFFFGRAGLLTGPRGEGGDDCVMELLWLRLWTGPQGV